ncbi:pollen-specific leucine-rich repeat extensin-like protein 4, partial [Dendrobium catenatum]|uniref:pollen-specific leucine-rich repeat extensin-like protein 4 n=1 Tax=Dendrobium catenatum TaxID=906689 RepID=UPI00109FD0D3
MVALWLRYGCAMVALWLRYGCAMIFNNFFWFLQIFICLDNVTNEEAEKYGADITAIQNLDTRSGHEPQKLHSPQKNKASAKKKIDTTPPPSPPPSPPLPPPDSPHNEPPETESLPPTQPSTRPPTEKISTSQPFAEQPPIRRADLEAVQNKCFEIFEKMMNKIQENVGARLDRLEDIVEKLQADQDSMKYKFIEFQMQCDHNQEKPHISSSASSFQSVNNTALHPSAQAPIQVVPPPPPIAKELPQPQIQEVPPPSAKELPPPPPIQVVPPPPPLAKELPQPQIQEVPPPSAKELPPPPPIQVVPPPPPL